MNNIYISLYHQISLYNVIYNKLCHTRAIALSCLSEDYFLPNLSIQRLESRLPVQTQNVQKQAAYSNLGARKQTYKNGWLVDSNSKEHKISLFTPIITPKKCFLHILDMPVKTISLMDLSTSIFCQQDIWPHLSRQLYNRNNLISLSDTLSEKIYARKIFAEFISANLAPCREIKFHEILQSWSFLRKLCFSLFWAFFRQNSSMFVCMYNVHWPKKYIYIS